MSTSTIFGNMTKYKVKKTKKPYNKSTSHENSATKGKSAVLDAKQCHLKESPLQTKVDCSKVVTPVTVEQGISSQCQAYGHSLV